MKDRKLWEKRLKSLKNYKEEKEKSDSLGSTLPPARYSGRIVSAEMTEASSKDLMIRVNMVVENDEEHDGVEQPSFLNLGEKSLRFSLATLKRLGYELSGDDTSEILDVVEELSDSGMGVNFKVGTSGFANILGPVDEGKEETSNESEEEVEEDKEESDEEEMNEDCLLYTSRCV